MMEDNHETAPLQTGRSTTAHQGSTASERGVKQISGDREDLLKEAREAEIVAQLDDEIVARLHRWLTSQGLKPPI